MQNMLFIHYINDTGFKCTIKKGNENYELWFSLNIYNMESVLLCALKTELQAAGYLSLQLAN